MKSAAGCDQLALKAFEVAAVGVLSVLISGCAGSTRFEISNMFFGESIELKRDGTFEYDSSSDEIGNECTAQGLWQKERRDGINYVVLDVRSFTRGGPQECRRVTEHRYWIISHGGIMSVNLDVIPRK